MSKQDPKFNYTNLIDKDDKTETVLMVHVSPNPADPRVQEALFAAYDSANDVNVMAAARNGKFNRVIK